MNLNVYHYLGTGVAADAQERSRVQVLELEAALGRMLADDEFALLANSSKKRLRASAIGVMSFSKPLQGWAEMRFARRLWQLCHFGAPAQVSMGVAMVSATTSRGTLNVGLLIQHRAQSFNSSESRIG